MVEAENVTKAQIAEQHATEQHASIALTDAQNKFQRLLGEQPCESCGKPATTVDVDGVPLCDKCYETEVRKAIEDASGEDFDS